MTGLARDFLRLWAIRPHEFKAVAFFKLLFALGCFAAVILGLVTRFASPLYQGATSVALILMTLSYTKRNSDYQLSALLQILAGFGLVAAFDTLGASITLGWLMVVFATIDIFWPPISPFERAAAKFYGSVQQEQADSVMIEGQKNTHSRRKFVPTEVQRHFVFFILIVLWFFLYVAYSTSKFEAKSREMERPLSEASRLYKEMQDHSAEKK